MDSPSLFDLKGRKALVTGASRGLGLAIAEALASSGAEVALNGRNADALAAAAEAVGGRRRHAPVVRFDLGDPRAVAKGVEQAAEALGGLDILVNNAGVEEVRPASEVDEALWERIHGTNLKGAFFCAQAAARIMQARGGGAIINICSLTSHVGVPTAVPYGSSKTGLLGMTRGLAAEWAPHGIRVNAIAPGYFRTAMTEVFYADPGWQEAMLARIPLGRFGRLKDVGGAVVFLASDAAAYVTGQCIAIDGGYLASI